MLTGFTYSIYSTVTYDYLIRKLFLKNYQILFQIWFGILFYLLVNIALFQTIVFNLKKDFSKITFILFGSLIKQSFTDLSRKHLERKPFLVELWLLFSLIIINCLSSVLLLIYFNVNSIPLVSSIDELVINDKISIIEMEDTLSMLKSIKPTEYRILSKRILNKQNMTRDEVVELAYNGKTVLMTHSITGNNIITQCSFYDLFVMPDKYLPNYVSLFVSNKTKYRRTIIKW